MRITTSPGTDLAALGDAWRSLEAQLDAPCFFRSWTWVGCLAEERFSRSLLVRAEVGGALAGLALFNRRRGRLCLGESGEAGMDSVFVEHNGPLHLPHPGLAEAMLRAAARAAGLRGMRISGVDAAVLAAAPGTVLRCQEREAPWVDLDTIRAQGGDHLATLSANARYQIRRSMRHYANPEISAASSLPEALEWLHALLALHERTWQARGKPGAFATPWLRRFHRALVTRGHPRGEVELLRVDSAGSAIGYLYNFRLGGKVLAYQSGFDNLGSGQHGKPGLTAHALAIQRAVAAGDTAYDFLGGAHRYKLSLANASTRLFWAELVPATSPAGLLLRLARRFAPKLGLSPG